MSTLTVERYPVREAMDAQVAAHMADDMVNIARSLFVLLQPAASSAAGPAAVNAPATAAPEAPALPAQPIPVPVPVPVPIPEGAPLRAAGPVAIPTLSAIPVPSLDRAATDPAVLAGSEAVAVPSGSAAPRTMAMLSEIGFLDD